MKETQSPETDNLTATGKFLKIAAYPVSFLTGFFVTKVNISDSAYNHFKHYDGIADIRKEGTGAIKKIFQEGIDNAKKGVGNEGFLKKVVEHRNEYFPKIEGRKKALGIHSFFDEWKVVHRSDKQNAVINGIMVTAVALGALLEVTNTKMFNNFFSRSDSQER